MALLFMGLWDVVYGAFAHDTVLVSCAKAGATDVGGPL